MVYYYSLSKLLFVIVCFIKVIHSANILAIFPMPSISHHILGTKITDELLKRGHHITIITAYPERLMNDDKEKRYETVSVEDNLNIFKDYSKSSSLNGNKAQDTDAKPTKSFFHREEQTSLEAIIYLNDLSLKVAENTLSNRNVQQLLKSRRKFDLIFMEYFLNEAYFGLGKLFDAPIVLLSTLPSSTFNDYLFANPGLPTYVPHILSPFNSDMNFLQRAYNILIALFDICYKHFIILPQHRSLSKKYVSQNIELDDVLYDVSLMLVNSHPSVNTAVPHVKNIIEIGGFHIEPVGNLSGNLSEILDTSENGVIIFSMGSNLNINDIPQDVVSHIMKSFSRIKQRIVLKWNGYPLKNLPENVFLVDWLPQREVLGHQNVRAFITHGGLLSVIESVYHGVPMIGIPIYGDQRMNMATASKHGYAITIPFEKVSEESLSKALNEIVANETYIKTAKLRSKILRDRMSSPLETAVYWIEYVIRFNGADHLRSPAVRLAWYQRDMLEIIVFLTLLTIILFLIFYYIIKHIIRCFFKSSKCKISHEKND